MNFARIVPGGLLVFFPSYGVLQACLEAWREPGPDNGRSLFDRIGAQKVCCVVLWCQGCAFVVLGVCCVVLELWCVVLGMCL